MPEWNLGICNEKSGFLFSHACDRLPVQNCSRCQKPICQEHAHVQDAGAMICTSCARRLDARNEQRGYQGRRGHRYYDGYYGDPYFYGRPYGYGWGMHRHRHHHHDPHDFTEADGESFNSHDDVDFESDLTES